MRIEIRHPHGEKIVTATIKSNQNATAFIGENQYDLRENENFNFNGETEQIVIECDTNFYVVGMVNYNWLFTLYPQEETT